MKSEANHTQEKAQLAQRLEVFRKGIERATVIETAYAKQYETFRKQCDRLEPIVAKTPIGHDLRLLSEKVSDAWELNIDAGWLSSGRKFDDLEYFTVLIKHDGAGRRFKSLSDVPVFLREEFEEWDESEFQAFMDEQRETCRAAYDEMPTLLEDLEEELAEGDFFDMLDSLPYEAGAGSQETKRARTLFDNVQNSWAQCKQTGLSLLHMANQLGDGDYDPGLMEALLFDR